MVRIWREQELNETILEKNDDEFGFFYSICIDTMLGERFEYRIKLRGSSPRRWKDTFP